MMASAQTRDSREVQVQSFSGGESTEPLDLCSGFASQAGPWAARLTDEPPNADSKGDEEEGYAMVIGP